MLGRIGIIMRGRSMVILFSLVLGWTDCGCWQGVEKFGVFVFFLVLIRS